MRVVSACVPALCEFDQRLHDEDVVRAMRVTVGTGAPLCITLMCGCPFISYPREVG